MHRRNQARAGGEGKVKDSGDEVGMGFPARWVDFALERRTDRLHPNSQKFESCNALRKIAISRLLMVLPTFA